MKTITKHIEGYGTLTLIDRKMYTSSEAFDLESEISNIMPAKYVCDYYNKEGRKRVTCHYVAVLPNYKGLTIDKCKNLAYSEWQNVVGYTVQGITTRRATY